MSCQLPLLPSWECGGGAAGEQTRGHGPVPGGALTTQAFPLLKGIGRAWPHLQGNSGSVSGLWVRFSPSIFMPSSLLSLRIPICAMGRTIQLSLPDAQA